MTLPPRHTRSFVLLAMPQKNSDFYSASVRLAVVLFVVLTNPWLLPQPSHAEEGWCLEGRGTLFYTDDLDLFFTTRRLSRDGLLLPSSQFTSSTSPRSPSPPLLPDRLASNPSRRWLHG